MEFVIGILVLSIVGFIGWIAMYSVGYVMSLLLKSFEIDKIERVLFGGLVISLVTLVIVLGNLAFYIGSAILK